MLSRLLNKIKATTLKVYKSIYERSTMSDTLTGCTHEFSYLLKKHGKNDYTGRVLQIPAVIVQGKSEEQVASKIPEATKDYLKTFREDHLKARKNLLLPILTSPAEGVIVKTQIFNVSC